MKKLLLATTILSLSLATGARAQGNDFGPKVAIDANLTAAGTTQATALPLHKQGNVLTSVASGAGVLLPSTGADKSQITIWNNGVNPLTVYPPGGGHIDALSNNTGYSLAPGTEAQFTSLGTVASPVGQWLSAPYGGGGGSSFNGGTITNQLVTQGGIQDTGGINTTAATGYSFNGVPALTIISPANANPVVAVGPGACAAMTTGANFELCVGNNALAAYSGTVSAEHVMLGLGAGSHLVPPSVHDVGTGTYAMHWETTGTSDTCSGGDCQRNTIGASQIAAFGSYSAGNYFGQLSAFVGANAMVGNAASVTIGPTFTTGDVIILNFASTAIVGGNTTVQYTVAAGNQGNNIANGLANAMTANSLLVNADIRSLYDGQATPATFAVAYPGTSTIGPAPLTVTNTSAGITEVVTISNGVTAVATRNVGVGFDAEYGSRWIGASYNVCSGAFCLANLTSGNQNVFSGDQAGMNGTAMTQSVGVGDEAYMNDLTGNANAGLGWEVGKNCTTCRNTLLLGKGAGTSTLTTGNDIIILTDGSACDTNSPNLMLICGSGGTFLQVTGTNTAATAQAMFSGSLLVGATTQLILANGELGLTKGTASGSAPGAAGLKLATVCGTTAGSAKLIVYAGNSTTPATLLDNIGTGVSGC